MELRHIRYFKAVAEEKSFTKAAEQLAIAQPPLSRQIQDLEAELGTTLFLRTPHKVSLTEEGELFLQYANQILDLVNRSEEDVRERKEGLQGTLYIASVEGCGPRLFAEWIAGFGQKHPHVQYNLWNGNTDDVNNRVTKGLCEIAMITARGTKLSIFDEPEAGIDLWSFNSLIRVFEKMRDEIQGTILIISHQERILDIAEKIIVIADGQLKKIGTKQEVLPELLGTAKACQTLTEKL